jgi:hypothetical protein
MFDSDYYGVGGGWNMLKNFLVSATQGRDLLLLNYLAGIEIIELDFHYIRSTCRRRLQKDAVAGSGCLLNGVLNIGIALAESMVNA